MSYTGNVVKFGSAGRVGPTYLTREEAARELKSVGFPLPDALAVFFEESWLSPDAMGDLNRVGERTATGEHWGPAVGITQIRTIQEHSGTGSDRDIEKLKGNARAQIEAGYRLYKAEGWRPWAAHSSGRYRQHVPWATEVLRSSSDVSHNEGAPVASRGSEQWWFQHWGQPCKGPRTKVRIRGHLFTVDMRSKGAFEALDKVFAKHGVKVNPPYPEGDSGTGNCRHIGNDPNRPWSAHAWWAALDRNWQTNPDGSRLKTDLAQSVIDDVHRLRTKKSKAPVMRWGGDWDRDPRTGHSYYDAMHFEVHATPTELAEGIVGQEDEMTPEQEKKLDQLLEWVGGKRGDYDTGLSVLQCLIESKDGVFQDGVKLLRREIAELRSIVEAKG